MRQRWSRDRIIEEIRRIAVDGEDPDSALSTEAERLTEVMEGTGAPCWAPDPESDGPCPVGG